MRSLCVAILLTLPLGHSQTPVSSRALQDGYNNLPLSFEENRGQARPGVKFLAHGRGSTLLLTPNEGQFQISGKEKQQTLLRFTFPGANHAPAMTGLDPQPGRSNYFLGGNAAQWQTNITHYSRVVYRDLYPGVDLVYYG